MIHRAKCIFILLSIVLIAGCTSACSSKSMIDRESGAPPQDRSGYFAEPEDFYGVFFGEGEPADDEENVVPLSMAVGSGEESLRHDLELMQRFPQSTKFIVLGFTDSSECSARECVSLSLRRAQFVLDWFVKNGMPKERFGAPQGYGSARPIGDNSTDAGRAMNRRAYVSDMPD